MKQLLKNKKTIVFLAIIHIINLSGCSVFKEKQQDNNLLVKQIAIMWDEHIEKISTITSWKFDARVQVKSTTDYAKFFVNWQQDKKNYQLVITGALGIKIADITGSDNEISLLTSRQNISSDNPNLAIAKFTGFKIPIDAIPYWIKGIPDNSSPASIDVDNAAIILQQFGYRIKFADYKKYKKRLLPTRINIINKEMSLTIIIDKWIIP